MRARTLTAVLDAIDAGRRPVDVDAMQRSIALLSRAELRAALLFLAMAYASVADGSDELQRELTWLRTLADEEGDAWLVAYAQQPITEAI